MPYKTSQRAISLPQKSYPKKEVAGGNSIVGKGAFVLYQLTVRVALSRSPILFFGLDTHSDVTITHLFYVGKNT